MEVKKGELYFADLGKEKSISNVQKGIRPCLIIQNNVGNKFSNTVIVAPLTSKIKKTDLKVHIEIKKDKNNGLIENSIVLLEQLKTIDKSSLHNKIGVINNQDLKNIDEGLKVSLAL